MLEKCFCMLSAVVFALVSFVPVASADQKLKVTATIFPLYDFAREIGRDKVDVSMFLPPGVEAHTFEPRPQDIVRLNNADVFLFTGEFMEPWAADVLKGVTNKNLAAVDTSTGITLLDQADNAHGHGHGHGEDHVEEGAAFEWAGAFELEAGEYVWSFAKVNGEYADPAMKMVILAADEAGSHGIEKNEAAAAAYFSSEAKEVKDGGVLEAFKGAYQLAFDGAKPVTSFRVKIAAKGAYVVFTEHMPMEFEAGEHFFKNAKGEDIEAKAEEPEAEHHHHHGGKDPHIWLDLELAQTMVDTIVQSFSQKDPANSAFYRANAESYQAKLKDLDVRYTATLSTCQIKTIIYAGHFAFGYFAKRYNLEHVSPYKGFSPDAEPAPKSIKKIIDTIKSVGSNTIYYEELIDPKVARMIAGETGARMELLHGAHNVSKDEMASLSYLKIMEANLPRLKEGLKCQ